MLFQRAFEIIIAHVIRIQYDTMNEMYNYFKSSSYLSSSRCITTPSGEKIVIINIMFARMYDIVPFYYVVLVFSSHL